MESKDFMLDDAVVAGIKADIDRYEQQRISAQRQSSWRVPVYLGSLAVVVVVCAWFFNRLADPYEQWVSAPHVFLYVGALVAGIVLYIRAVAPAGEVKQSFREQLLPVVFGFIQDMRYQQGKMPDTFGKLPRETVGAFNKQKFDDIVSGKYQGFAFELYEATFENKSGNSEEVKFKGVVMSFETPRPFPGLLIATRKSNQVTNLFRGLFGGSGLEDLPSGIEALDRIYDFRTDNVEAARPLVTGRLAKALEWLGATWPDEQALVALKDGDGFLLLPQQKDFFELPGAAVAVDFKIHIEPMIADMAALLATAALVRQVGAADDVMAS